MAKSDFGDGFVYCLFLFAKHQGRLREQLSTWAEMKKKAPDLFSEADAISLWFTGAGDHLFGLNVPEKWKGTKIDKLATKLRNKGLSWRMNELGGLGDLGEYFDDMEKLCRLVDREIGGVEVIKAQWN